MYTPIMSLTQRYMDKLEDEGKLNEVISVLTEEREAEIDALIDDSRMAHGHEHTYGH